MVTPMNPGVLTIERIRQAVALIQSRYQSSHLEIVNVLDADLFHKLQAEGRLEAMEPGIWELKTGGSMVQRRMTRPAPKPKVKKPKPPQGSNR